MELDTGTLQCIDINECMRSSACNSDQECFNYSGGFQCCDSGYTTNRYANWQCQDIDECAVNSNSCDYYTESCENTPGSFKCSCKSGYQDYGNGCVRKTTVSLKKSVLFLKKTDVNQIILFQLILSPQPPQQPPPRPPRPNQQPKQL